MATKTKTKAKTTAKKTTTRTTTVKTATQPAIGTFGKIWRFVLCVAVPLGGGFVISMFTRNAMEQFNSMNQPPLAPPAWLFPVAWTILYILMGVASYLIWWSGVKGNKQDKAYSKMALIVYGVQLAFNFVWTPLFFSLGWYWFAFAWLLVMLAMVICLTIKARKLSMAAMWMLIPYVAWCCFAAYLNCGIAILN